MIFCFLDALLQEPVLYGRSIRRNICFGLEAEDGVPPDEVPTEQDVLSAARLANAHEFIMAMPQGYDTVRLIHAGFIQAIMQFTIPMPLRQHGCFTRETRCCRC